MVTLGIGAAGCCGLIALGSMSVRSITWVLEGAGEWSVRRFAQQAIGRAVDRVVVFDALLVLPAIGRAVGQPELTGAFIGRNVLEVRRIDRLARIGW